MNHFEFWTAWVVTGLAMFFFYQIGKRGKDKAILEQWDITVQERRRAENFKLLAEGSEKTVEKLLKQVDEYRQLSAKARELISRYEQGLGYSSTNRTMRSLSETIDQLNTVAYEQHPKRKP